MQVAPCIPCGIMHETCMLMQDIFSWAFKSYHAPVTRYAKLDYKPKLIPRLSLRVGNNSAYNRLKTWLSQLKYDAPIKVKLVHATACNKLSLTLQPLAMNYAWTFLVFFLNGCMITHACMHNMVQIKNYELCI